jgi:uncharacterized membrane protein YgcG
MADKLASAGPKRRAAWRLASVLALAASLLGVAELTLGDDRVPGRPIDSVIRLLEGRSPGERGSADLTKLKQKVSKNRTEELHERVLGKVFPPAPPTTVPPEDLLASPPLLDSTEFEYPPTTFAGRAEDIRVPPGAALYYGPPVGGGSGGNNGGDIGGSTGGGGGGGSGGGPVITPVVPEVPSAVPEPETWALMLLGAALSAAALRRGKCSQRRRATVDADA